MSHWIQPYVMAIKKCLIKSWFIEKHSCEVVELQSVLDQQEAHSSSSHFPAHLKISDVTIFYSIPICWLLASCWALVVSVSEVVVIGKEFGQNLAMVNSTRSSSFQSAQLKLPQTSLVLIASFSFPVLTFTALKLYFCLLIQVPYKYLAWKSWRMFISFSRCNLISCWLTDSPWTAYRVSKHQYIDKLLQGIEKMKSGILHF